MALPKEVWENIFSNLSFEDSKEFGDEKFWRWRCNKNLSVTKRLFNKSWRQTYKIHEMIFNHLSEVFKRVDNLYRPEHETPESHKGKTGIRFLDMKKPTKDYYYYMNVEAKKS